MRTTIDKLKECPYRVGGKKYWEECGSVDIVADLIEAVEKLTADQEDAKADICRNYCKYPNTWDEEKEGMEFCESDLCYNCPLGRIGV